MTAEHDLRRLLEIMAQLRTPGSGCPWDLAQDFSTIAPYTIEEAYEVADAIARGDLSDLKEELGDLLLQVVFHARMAEEQTAFDFGDVVRGLIEKLIRRHPHVFGSEGKMAPHEVAGLWSKLKNAERSERAVRAGLDVPLALPALTRARKLQERAAAFGFDWSEPDKVMAKVEEETAELRMAMGDPSAAAEELGDLLFAIGNLARHLNVDPESALQSASKKFERRFVALQAAFAASGRDLQQATLAEMDDIWEAVKATERS